MSKIVKIPRLRFTYFGKDTSEARVESERGIKMAYNRIFRLAYKPRKTLGSDFLDYDPHR